MKMLRGNIILIVVMAMFSALLFGCAGNLPEAKRVDILDMYWGKSFESAKNNQILNPDAGKNLDPVVGLDGKAADYAVDKYKESFKTVVPIKTTTSFNITEQGGVD